MKYTRLLLEKEAPEELGYDTIKFNLSESSISDRLMGEFDVDLSELILLYGDHKGLPELRNIIAKQADHPAIKPEQVLATTGAAGALFIIATSLLEKESHLIVVRPNYATNIETPRAIGCEISLIDLRFESQFKLDLNDIEKAIKPNTKLISVTVPHNPSGTMVSWEDLKRLEKIAEKHDCLLLVDETYRDLTTDTPYPSAAGISPRVIAVSSVSKAYGTPGLRLGWLITRDPDLFELFLSAKEQIGICGSVVDEMLAFKALEGRDEWLKRVRAMRARRLEIMKAWIASEELVDWVEPAGGVVCFPRMNVPETFNYAKFYDILLSKYGTYVGRGPWFEMPDNFMRIGFAWPTEEELKEGLKGISSAIRETL